MMRISYQFHAFPTIGPWSIPNGLGMHQTNWTDLAWAAVTVGRRNLGQVLKHGAYSWFEIMYRAHMLWANLRTDGRQRITRTAPYRALDPSEKGAVSYFLGLATAKLFAADFLQVPWLTHMSAFSNGKLMSPDLIGRRRGPGLSKPGDWVVIEAKGRTHGMTTKVHADALGQAKKPLSLIYRGKRVAPALRVASITYFKRGYLTVHWEDPEEDSVDDHEPRSLEVGEEAMIRRYYEPIVTLLRSPRFGKQERTLGERQYTFVQIEELDFAVGLDTQVAEEPGEAPSVAAVDSVGTWFNGRSVAKPQQGDPVVYPDGVAIVLGASWSDDHMSLEPPDR